MVAKDFFPFATVTNGCKEAKIMEFSHKYDIFDTTSWKVSQTMLNIQKNSMKFIFLQPSVMVAKGKISFATMTPERENPW